MIALAETVLDLIHEMAFEPKEAKKTLLGLQDTVAYHLFKLYHQPQSRSAGPWLRELRAHQGTLFRKNRGKKGRDNFSRGLLIKVLWTKPFGTEKDIDANIKSMIFDGLIEEPSEVSFDRESFKSFVIQYIDSTLDGKQFIP